MSIVFDFAAIAARVNRKPEPIKAGILDEPSPLANAVLFGDTIYFEHDGKFYATPSYL